MLACVSSVLTSSDQVLDHQVFEEVFDHQNGATVAIVTSLTALFLLQIEPLRSNFNTRELSTWLNCVFFGTTRHHEGV